MNKNTKITVAELLEDINAKIEHIEDITADNRAIIVKLVKQNNQIVKFLEQLEVEDVTDEFDSIIAPESSVTVVETERAKHIRELIEQFMDKHKDLKELEKELKKHKNQIIPGQIGES